MSLTFDFRGWERGIRRVAEFERQIPFALAQALNRSVEVARREIIDTTWAQHVKVRNPRFLENALTTRGSKATKRNLRVVLYDKNGRGNLKLHDDGRAARTAAAPWRSPSRRSAPGAPGEGVPKGMQPRNLCQQLQRGREERGSRCLPAHRQISEGRQADEDGEARAGPGQPASPSCLRHQAVEPGAGRRSVSPRLRARHAARNAEAVQNRHPPSDGDGVKAEVSSIWPNSTPTLLRSSPSGGSAYA